MATGKRGVVIALIAVVTLLLIGIIILLYNPKEKESPPPADIITDTENTGDERFVMLDVDSSLEVIEFLPRDASPYSIIIDKDAGSVNVEAEDMIFRVMQDELEMLMYASVMLNSLIRISENADDAQLTLFGFDNPRLTWYLHYEDGTSDTVLVGDDLPTGDGSYIRLQDSREVYCIGSVQTGLLLRPLEELYNISFLPLPPSTEEEPTWMYISGAALVSDEEMISFYRRAEEELAQMPLGTSSFVMMQPFVTDCSDYMIQTVFLEPITHISPVSIVEIMPTDLKVYGLDNPARLTVNLPLQSDTEYQRTLLIGDYDAVAEGHYVMIEGHDAVLLDGSGYYGFLDVSPFQLQAKIIWLHNIDTVSSVEFTLDGTDRTLTLDEKDGELTGELDGVRLSSDNTRRLYTSVFSILASGGTDAGIPDTAPAYIITINFKDGTDETLELYPIGDAEFLIVYEGETTNSYITRIALYQNLLSRFEILDEGGDLRRS